MDKELYGLRRHLLELGSINMPTGRREKYAAQRGLRGLSSTNPVEIFKDPKLKQLAGSWDLTPDQIRKAAGAWDSRQTTLRSLMVGHSTHHLGSMSAEGGDFLRQANDNALYDFHGRMNETFGYSTGSEDAALRSQNDFAHTGKNPGGESGASSVSSHRTNKNGKRASLATPDESGKELFERYKPVAQQNLDDFNFAQSSPPAQADTAAINTAGKKLGIDDAYANQGSLALDDIKKIRESLKGITTPADGGGWWNGLSPSHRRALRNTGLLIGGTTIASVLDAADLYAGTRDLTNKDSSKQKKKEGLVQGGAGLLGLASLSPAVAPVLGPIAAGLGLGSAGTQVAKSNRVHNPAITSYNKHGEHYQLDSKYQHTPEQPVTVQEHKPYVPPKPKYKQNRQGLRTSRPPTESFKPINELKWGWKLLTGQTK